jgi:hypothetical protein
MLKQVLDLYRQIRKDQTAGAQEGGRLYALALALYVIRT